MSKTKSIRDVLNEPKTSQPKVSLDYIHSLLDDKNYVELVLCITEYGFRRFFQDYRIFLGSSHLGNLYWEEAFEVFIHPTYSQLWLGLDRPPKEKKRSSRYEWYDNLVMGHV
jgi:hypothetical protein